jgi:predicted DNA-binding transcriptional regulator YafY
LRDIQELTVSGYPIQADMGRGGGVRWIGNKKQFPFNERQKLALQNAILSN